MRWYQVIVATASMLMMVACSSGANVAPLSASSAADQEYRLGAGDKISVYVYGLDQFNHEYVVGDSGTLSFPLIQTLSVSGRTLRELELMIASKLANEKILRDPVVTAQSVTLRSFYVTGEVRNPGEYAFRPGTTVFSAIALAGGFTYRASTRQVVITRMVGGQSVRGSATQDSKVMPGDRIEVVEKWF